MDISEKLKTVKQQINKTSKTKKVIWPYVVLIVFLLWVAISLANANAEYSNTNEETAKRLDEVHRELDSLREDYSKFKIDTEVKQAKGQVSTAPTQPPPTQRPILSGGNRGVIEAYILTKFGVNGPRAIQIAACESGIQEHGDDGKAGERGVFQIHPVHANSMTKHGFTWDQMYTYKSNVDYAYLLFTWQGWKPWTCRYLV